MYGVLAIRAVRDLAGTLLAIRREAVSNWRPLEETDSVETPGEAELRAIAVWRLQRVWDDLTPHQRLGLFQLVSGAELKHVAKEHKINWRVLSSAKVRAVRHLAEATTPKRKRPTCFEPGCNKLASNYGRCPNHHYRALVQDEPRRLELRAKQRAQRRRKRMERKAA